MPLLRTILSIWNHPNNSNNRLRAIGRFIYWQLGIRLFPYPVVYPYASKSKFIVSKGQTGLTANIYYGLHEFEDMSFLLHTLRPSDLFVDVGANAGSYTILSASEIGAQTISIEPIPSTFEQLKNNVAINNIESKVKLFNVGIGSEENTLKFTSDKDSQNHVGVGLSEEKTIEVPIKRLDDIIDWRGWLFMKIDVEGYETEVLKGMKELLKKAKVIALIIELNGSGERYGFEEEDIHQSLLQYGFEPHGYDPKTRQLFGLSTYGSDNTIYINKNGVINSRLNAEI